MVDQKTGKLRVIARGLPTDTSVRAGFFGLGKEVGDRRRDRRVLLVEQMAEHVTVAVDAKNQLGQVV